MAEITFEPNGKKMNVLPGTSLLTASRKARVVIATRCGGKASCLMCKVIVYDQTYLSKPEQKEQLKLGQLLDDHYRLACQARVIGGSTVVTIPESPLKRTIQALLDKQKKEQEDDLW